MQHIFTNQYSNTQVRSIWRDARFGGRTRCIRCGWTRKFWNLSDGRWQCSRCNKKFGWITDTPISGFRLSLQDILELLWWFELGLTDHGIAARTKADYHQIHRFFRKVRQSLFSFENSHIQVVDGQLEIDESYFCPIFENRHSKKHQWLLRSGKVKSYREDKQLQQPIFIIYQRQDGIVFVKPTTEVDQPMLQNIIKEKVAIETTIYSNTEGACRSSEENSIRDQTTNGTKAEYPRDGAGISGIEDFWEYAKKRLLRYHGVSPSNFLDYLKEIEFRFNHRRLTQEQFVNHLLFILIGDHSDK